MKERRVVFALLLLWALAFGVKSWLGSQTTPFKAFFFGLGDSLILVGVLYLIWNWVASRRTIHSRGVLRRVVFGFLLGWALLDAVLSGLEARALQAPAWVGLVVFFLSLGWSLIFIVVLYLAWNWIAGLRRRGVRAAIIVGLVVVSAIGLLALGFLTDSKQRTSAESEVPQDAAVTKSQTPKTPPSPAASQETASPHLPGQQPSPTPSDLAPVVIEQPTPAPLEPGSQNLPLDASLSKGKATYRISGVKAGDFLNMRQGPGMSYSIIQRLQNGVDGVTLIGDPIRTRRTKWQKINSRGVVGWVNADYLTPSDDGQNTQGPVAPNVRGR